jgi:hypothetical protein
MQSNTVPLILRLAMPDREGNAASGISSHQEINNRVVLPFGRARQLIQRQFVIGARAKLPCGVNSREEAFFPPVSKPSLDVGLGMPWLR